MALDGDYSGFKHYKGRKVIAIEIEFPEERAQEVIEYLGMPLGGSNKPVAVALLDKAILAGKVPPEPRVKLHTEGEALRIRAVLLCQDPEFQFYISELTGSEASEDNAVQYIYNYCSILSRSEIATSVVIQEVFKELLAEYDTWELERQYADNLCR